MEVGRLFGRPVIRDSERLSLADQIHDILCEEIHAGRWEVGEKLPSMTTIARECRVSRMPVQQAIERLGEKGYLRQENRSGVYLSSTMPDGRTPVGTIGVLLRGLPDEGGERKSVSFLQGLLHVAMEQIEAQNYQTRAVYVSRKDDQQSLNKVGYLFDEDVKGIISLFPFYRPLDLTLGADRIPLVFWCGPTPRCAPCIASDYAAAFYHLTRKIISSGHAHITPVPGPGLSAYVHDRYLRGYRTAMREARLQPDESLLALLEDADLNDLAALARALKGARQTSCFLSLSLERAEQLIGVLELSGVDVPGDVSVASPNAPFNRTMPNGRKLSGVAFSPKHELELCMQSLRQQMIERKWMLGTMLAAPFLVEGETLAPPGRK